MGTREDVARQPIEERLRRLARTAGDLVACLHGQEPAALVRRPTRESWAPIEILCHVRDIEELVLMRLELIAAVDEPVLGAAGHGTRALGLRPDGQAAAPDRWAEDRQYLGNDAVEALAAFRRRREETLAHLGSLEPAGWQRGGLHPRRGRMTVDDFVTDQAWHDDVHLDQLRRALDGKP
jgi:DinB family protein